MNISVREVFYDKKMKAEDDRKNQQYKVIAKYIDKIIDTILNELAIRRSNKNAHYTWYMNNTLVKMSYETDIWGRQPRYKIDITEPHGNYGYHYLFKYYHGEINKFTAPFECTNTLVTEINIEKLQIFVDAINLLIKNEKLECSGKLIKYINKIKENQNLIL